MDYTTEQIWDMIRGERTQNEGTVAPYGNYTRGLNLEEYHVDGKWVQVALDPCIGGEIVDFHVSDVEEDEWQVG